MNLLTRTEELILLAIWKLSENAYCVPIQQMITNITGEELSLGSIYMPLDRLVKRGLLDSYLTDSTPERGGRHKRIYRLTTDGKKELLRIRDVSAAMWDNTDDLIIEM